MIKRYTKDIYFDFYLNAAKKLHIPCTFLIPNSATAVFFKNKKRLFVTFNKIGVNNAVSSSFAYNKHLTFRILKNGDIPHPHSVLIPQKMHFEEILKQAESIEKPWVVKPIKGSEGIGITVKISTQEQLNKAVKFARKYNNTIMIEEFLEGTNYRILIFKDKILDIVERIPAYVDGNGQDTITELIEKKNNVRSKVGLQLIRIDFELQKELKNNKLTLLSKIEKGRRLFLRKSCNMCSGGETKRIAIKTVHKDNIDMFFRAKNLLGLEIAGIDFITPDITTSYKKIRSGINEINRAPMLNVHYFADMKMDNTLAEKILSMYFNC
jgi:cyanophycin synthetase